MAGAMRIRMEGSRRMPRVQAIIVRENRVLMVKQQHAGKAWWCLPGGAQEPGETPEQGALRELREECNVKGTIIRRTAHMSFASEEDAITFLVDIGAQTPFLGHDPEAAPGLEALLDLRWMKLWEIPARDRTFLWAAGLLGVDPFLDEVSSWGSVLQNPGPDNVILAQKSMQDREQHIIPPSIKVRDLVESDIDGAHACMDSIAREGMYFIRSEAPPLEAFRSFMLDKLHSGSPCIVAVDGEIIAGYCDLSPLKPDGFTHVARLGMGVLKTHRERGVGKTLLGKAIQKAAAMGLERLELEVFASNHIAIHLYERFGFQVEGVKKRIRKSERGYDDLVQMAKFLGSPAGFASENG
jgi:ADP-ribose pyrophosphatase YjhB (NUDIX family)/ribosomal protein S18 acetylase RimI-like enzyme